MNNLVTNFVYDEPEDQKTFHVFPAGEYPFRVLEVNEMRPTSTDGTPMLPIKLEFTNDEGHTTTVYENLLFKDSCAWKTKAFLKAISGGRLEVGRQINFADPTFLGWIKRQTGRAKLKTSEVPGKAYERNEIASYVFPPKVSAPAPAPEPEVEVEQDDIPF
jgi:hypothetical protein